MIGRSVPQHTRFSCFGVSVELHVNGDLGRTNWQSLLPPGSLDQKADTPLHSLTLEPASGLSSRRPTSYVLRRYSYEPSASGLRKIRRRPSRLSRPLPRAAALHALRKELQLCVAENAPEHVFVHSGVVIWNKRAILLPGRSGAGKSTLVWRFLEAGARYFSDEFAVFTSDGRVWPFQVPINLRQEHGSDCLIVSETTRYAGFETIAPPGLILFSQYRTGAMWRPRALTRGEALLGLLRNSIAARKCPARTLHAIRSVVVEAPSYGSNRGDCASLIRSVASLMP
jgi:hypothetical protein